MKFVRATAAAVMLVSTLGCSSDVTGVAVPEPLALDGDWSYVANDLSGRFFDEEVTCEYGFDMNLTLSGSTFSGIYDHALLTCFLFGEDQAVDGGRGDIVGGILTGSAVQFDVDTDNIRNTGTLFAEGMSGDVSIRLIVQRFSAIDTVDITGTWSASR